MGGSIVTRNELVKYYEELGYVLKIEENEERGIVAFTLKKDGYTHRKLYPLLEIKLSYTLTDDINQICFMKNLRKN